LAAVATGGEAPEWRPAAPGHDWSFPRDHGSHSGYRTEWWYFTGHLSTGSEDEPRFGYQFTLFRVGLVAEQPPWNSGWAASDLIMGHAAITDLVRGEHRFSELLYRATPLLGGFLEGGDSLIAWTRCPPGSDGEWRLLWNGSGFDFEMRDETRAMDFRLHTHSARPPVLHGTNGWSPKAQDPSFASNYYSFPHLVTAGTISLDGDSWQVSGESWMDKEFSSSQLADDQVGWDWFSLRLDDGRALMLYLLRAADGSADWTSGTFIDADGSTRGIGDDEWSLTTNSTWKSEASGAEYPASWRLELPGEDLELEITPDVEDQENRSRWIPELFYWEGSVKPPADLRLPVGPPTR
jgi:predicted secreted hydrolase